MTRRTCGWRATADTTRSISAWRISSVTSCPRMRTRSPSKEIGAASASEPSAEPSSRSTPFCSASQVSARYMAPVSRYRKPRRPARLRATVLLPAPAGPSMATIIRPPACSPDRDGLEHREEVGEAYPHAFGALDAYSLTRDETRDCGDHRDAVISSCVNHTPTLRAGGNPTHPEAIVRRFDANSKRTEHVFYRLDPVRFLNAQLCRASHDALAVGHSREEREQRQLVHQGRHLLRADGRSDKIGVRHFP